MIEEVEINESMKIGDMTKINDYLHALDALVKNLGTEAEENKREIEKLRILHERMDNISASISELEKETDTIVKYIKDENIGDRLFLLEKMLKKKAKPKKQLAKSKVKKTKKYLSRKN